MTSTRFALATALTALLALVVGIGPAQAYPDDVITIEGGGEILYTGNKFTVTASSDASGAWRADFLGKVRKGQGRSLTVTYRAPKVTKRTRYPLTFTLDTGKRKGTVGRAVLIPVEVLTRTVMITVLPRPKSDTGSGNNSGSDSASPNTSNLPNTGGPRMALLVGSLVLLSGGAGLIVISRRRTDSSVSH